MTISRAWVGSLTVVVAVLSAAGCKKASTGAAGNGSQCTVNIDCPANEYCVSGVCNTPGMITAGGLCTASRDCATGLYCSALGTCATGGTLDEGGSCTTDGVCKPPLRCNLTGFFGTCGAAGTAESGATCTSSTDCLAGLLCGASKTCLPPFQAFPPYAGATCTNEGPFRIYFEVPRVATPPKDFFRLPFPNDIRVNGGALDLSDFPKPGPTPLGVDLVQLYVDSWTTDFDGFSAIGVTTFRFSGDIDYATSTGDNVWLVDVTPGAGGRQYGRNWLFTPARTKYSCEHRMTVRNGTDAPLTPKHTYAVILTTGIKSDKGEALSLDPDMTAMLAATAPTDATLMHAWTTYQPLRDWLASPGTGVTAPPVAAAAVFTVQDAPGHVQRLATSLAAQPAPVLKDVTLCAAGVKSPCDDTTPARACPATPDPAFDEIHGRFTVPIYQKGTEPYDTPDMGGGIVENSDGVPAVDRTEDVCFALTVPKAATAPKAGWPLMVYHHGTGGSFRSFIDEGLAAKLAGLATPSAVFSFDAVEHGARKGTSTKSPNDLVFNPLNPRAARDNFLQGAVDVLQAFRVAGVELDAATTGAAVAFDATKVTYFGHSQGSTSGALAVAFSDAAPATVFSGAGSFLTHSLLDKTNPVNIAAGMTFLLGEALDDSHPVLTIFQSFFDRSDPLNYNGLIIQAPPAKLHSKHVFMSYGTLDTYTPASTLQATEASLGLPHPMTVLLDGPPTPTGPRPVSLNMKGGDGQMRTAGMFVYSPDGYDGHFVALQNPAAITDWSAFLGSYLATGTPTVP
jgi:predicted esterase